MPRRGKQKPYEERLACMNQVEAGKTDVQIAQEHGWSKWTVRKWRRAYRAHGEAGLVSVMGRPKKGVLSSYSSQVRKDLEETRRGHPGWGPITLIEEMTLQPEYFGVSLPSRARVAAFLKEKNLVRSYEHHAQLPKPENGPVLQPHDEWEMDAQGKQEVDGLGQVSVVNILDVVSHLKTESYPHVWGDGLTWLDYQFVLRSAFVQFGFPKTITLDHDSAFFDNTSLSPYPSRLHLWLVGLGVSVVFITKPPPLQHAMIERGHQTMTSQAITGQTWHTQTQLWQALTQRRDFLNQIYPSRSLAYQSPLEAFPQAIHAKREYRPEWEAELLNLDRVDYFLAQGRWFRETNLHGEFWLGMRRYNAGIPAAFTTQDIRFDPGTREFVVKTVGLGIEHRFPAKGLAKLDLMGEMLSLSRFVDYQLALPFSHDVWRRNELTRMVGGTTL